MTQDEIILETICFYAADPVGRRSIEQPRYYYNRKPRCFYTHPSEPDRHCAVGRCMTSKALNAIGVSLLDVTQLAEEIPNMRGIGKHVGATPKDSIDKVLRKEYRGHSAKFWRTLQELHDNSVFWLGDEAAKFRRMWCMTFLPKDSPVLRILEEKGLITKEEPALTP